MRKAILLFIATASLIFAGEKHEHEGLHLEEIPMTQSQMEELGIKLYTVKKEPTGRAIKIPAEVHENPQLSYTVVSPVEGIVRKLYVKEGDFVRKGSVLAEIYSPELADLIGQREMAKVRMESARKVFERDSRLYKEGVIQYSRYFTSLTEYERAKGEYEALTKRIKSYGKVNGYHLVLTSPGRGYIVEQNVVLGDSVGTDRELFKIHSHEVLWIYGWADEKSARELKEGMKASVITAEGGLSCSIDYIGHEVDRKTRRVKVRCIAKNRDHLLKPGMFVSLLVRTKGKKAILIPKTAVQDIEGKKVVFVRTEDGFEPKEIHILRELDGYYVIHEGLKEGDRVAVSGTVFLKTKLTGVEEGGHAH